MWGMGTQYYKLDYPAFGELDGIDLVLLLVGVLLAALIGIPLLGIWFAVLVGAVLFGGLAGLFELHRWGARVSRERLVEEELLLPRPSDGEFPNPSGHPWAPLPVGPQGGEAPSSEETLPPLPEAPQGAEAFPEPVVSLLGSTGRHCRNCGATDLDSVYFCEDCEEPL